MGKIQEPHFGLYEAASGRDNELDRSRDLELDVLELAYVDHPSRLLQVSHSQPSGSVNL